jgi:hypothetical protein
MFLNHYVLSLKPNSRLIRQYVDGQALEPKMLNPKAGAGELLYLFFGSLRSGITGFPHTFNFTSNGYSRGFVPPWVCLATVQDTP